MKSMFFIFLMNKSLNNLGLIEEFLSSDTKWCYEDIFLLFTVKPISNFWFKSQSLYVVDLIAFSLPSFDFCRWAFIYVKITLFTYIAELFSIFPMYFLTKGIHDCDCLVVALTHVDFESLLMLGWWNGRVWIAVWMVIIDENCLHWVEFFWFWCDFFFSFRSWLIRGSYLVGVLIGECFVWRRWDIL